mgnify:CR=1 FL=1
MSKLSDLHLRILEKESIECADVEALLGDYADNDLNPALKARIESHINKCEECQESEKDYRMVIELAHELPVIPVPAEVRSRLRKALNEKLGIQLSLD